MDNFLHNQGKDGERAGEGQFTIAGTKALEKLSKFALQDITQWVLSKKSGSI